MDENNLWIVENPIAHRGFHDNNVKIPENSFLAFEKAINEGFAIEMDIQILKDGNIIVFHDLDLNRACGKNKRIRDLKVSEISGFRLFNSDCVIPLLPDVLRFVDSKVPLLIELKNFTLKKSLEHNLLKILNSYQGQFALQSFNPFSVRWLKRKKPEYTIGQLATNIKLPLLFKYVEKKILVNRRMKADFIGIDVDGLPNKNLSFFKDKGIPILGWTVRSKEQQNSVSYICDNVIFENYYPNQ